VKIFVFLPINPKRRKEDENEIVFIMDRVISNDWLGSREVFLCSDGEAD
jgi:hypothetical protein